MIDGRGWRRRDVEKARYPATTVIRSRDDCGYPNARLAAACAREPEAGSARAWRDSAFVCADANKNIARVPPARHDHGREFARESEIRRARLARDEPALQRSSRCKRGTTSEMTLRNGKDGLPTDFSSLIHCLAPSLKSGWQPADGLRRSAVMGGPATTAAFRVAKKYGCYKEVIAIAPTRALQGGCSPTDAGSVYSTRTGAASTRASTTVWSTKPRRCIAATCRR